MSTKLEPQVICRLLPEDEWERLKSIYDSYDAPLPNKGEAQILVIEREERIIGSLPIHTLLFIGLTFVEPDERNKGVAELLALAADRLFEPGQSAFMLTENEQVRRLVEKFGMVRVAGEVWRKDY